MSAGVFVVFFYLACRPLMRLKLALSRLDDAASRAEIWRRAQVNETGNDDDVSPCRAGEILLSVATAQSPTPGYDIHF